MPLDGTLEAEIFRDKDLKRCAVCGGVFVPKSNRAKYWPRLAPPEFTGGRKQKVNEKEVCCGQLGAEKALIYQAPQAPSRGGWYKLSQAPENGLLTVHKTRYDKHDLHHQPEKAFSFTRLPNFSLKPPHSSLCPNEAKVLYAFILRRTELSRKNGWADDCGRIYLYYPICEVVTCSTVGGKRRSIPCGNCSMPDWWRFRNKAVENPTAFSPNPMKRFQNTDFKKSGYGTPEG